MPLNTYRLGINSLLLIRFIQLQNKKLNINRNKTIQPTASYLILIQLDR